MTEATTAFNILHAGDPHLLLSNTGWESNICVQQLEAVEAGHLVSESFYSTLVTLQGVPLSVRPRWPLEWTSCPLCNRCTWSTRRQSWVRTSQFLAGSWIGQVWRSAGEMFLDDGLLVLLNLWVRPDPNCIQNNSVWGVLVFWGCCCNCCSAVFSVINFTSIYI